MVLATVLPPNQAAAYGWVKDPGSAYVKAAVGTFVSEESEEGAGLKYLNQSARMYAEIGVAEGLHIQLDGEYVLAANEKSASDVRYVHRGLGDFTGGVRYRLAAEPVALSLGVDVKTPLYRDVVDVDGADEVGDMAQFPDLGDGETDASFGAGAGLSLHPLPMWAGVWLAYQRRGGVFRDTGKAAASVGGTVAELVGLSVGLDAAYALSEDEVTKSWVMVQTQTWLDFGVGVSPELFFGFMPWTKNTEAGMQLLLGVSWKR